MFDQIDAAYYRLRAGEEREKAQSAPSRAAEKYRRRAIAFEAKARLLLGTGPSTGRVSSQNA
jgi:hypothetical protein